MLLGTLKRVDEIILTGNLDELDQLKLKVNDIITKVNGVKVMTTNEFRVIIEESDLRQGDRIKIQIYRNGRYLNKILALGKVDP